MARLERLKKLRQIVKADDGVHSIEEILPATKKTVKKPKEKCQWCLSDHGCVCGMKQTDLASPQSSSGGGKGNFYATIDKERWVEGTPTPGTGSVTVDQPSSIEKCEHKFGWSSSTIKSFCAKCGESETSFTPSKPRIEPLTKVDVQGICSPDKIDNVMINKINEIIDLLNSEK